ncbi:alkylresorcinol/alkylpyrone synthase [Mycolicibacterium sp. BK556]|uniref:type III polyketide synthase n=1 Tax=Mycobacteriaceae TaxID=1762 RepID=UPI0010EDB049|nr:MULTISPECIES: 3-oxoacyl-[acyl-carrier-protein] synthase III C-terminal domain-containing protein [Mycobacteriaceae]MBB3603845.1 alkylresorcinol/alkylpyrone synthase [Mycolicibacterium sp. BK556]MBB3634040.1 alkylresorcinol/alkylpyrone synthase [Mycolicibacterium sp. BK607]MBB3751621.1 alkylresorcinol/alkylpyrone synthase [Mycolicibacterium sp. BK634]TDO12135.1 alkylresorcinol/alkylpyrone synthase [Mycobacterium sp. BK086]
MTDTAFYRSLNSIGVPQRGDPRIAGTAVAFTPHRHNQDEVAAALTEFADPAFARFAQTSGVEYRNLALPLERYPEMSGFTEANAAYLEVAVELGEQALRRALDAAHIRPDEVDAIVSVSSTGVAVPTIDARIASRVGLRPDIKRIPLFGLGCVAGAAGLARVHDYLRGFPDHIAVLLSVELCSLTLQRDDTSIPALIGVCLFGDGAAAVVGTGADRAPAGLPLHPGPRVLATRSRLFADTVDVMGWNVSSNGFQLVMSRDVPNMAQDHLAEEVDRFLADHGLTTADIATWVCHPGGPKVLDAISSAVDVPPEALRHSWESMRDNGNISSASVLDVLDRTIAEPPAAGSLGVMLAMGPGFSFELLLLSW